jgi:hypothetical protein
MTGEFCLLLPEWARQFAMPTELVPEVIGQWVAEGIVTAYAYDGGRFKPIEEWPDQAASFSNTTDHGFVRVSLTATGLAQAERLRDAGLLWGEGRCPATRPPLTECWQTASTA